MADTTGDAWLLSGPEGVPLQITGSVPRGSHTQVGVQTLTFTFGEDVSGFAAGDVTLSGGTASQFTMQPGGQSVYTMTVECAGGDVEAHVSSGAATGLVSGKGSEAASYGFFYQDSRTFSLPGDVPIVLIRIPHGTFTMGTPPTEVSHFGAEAPMHDVTFSSDFYLSRTEVTQSQWLAVRGAWPGTGPNDQLGLGATYPAYDLSWDDIQVFLSDINSLSTGVWTFRLPTEAQWEYACRAGTSTRFSFGDGLGADELCSAETERTNGLWYCGNSYDQQRQSYRAHPVGQKPANGFGLYDMHGNVMEWCADWGGSYTFESVVDPEGPTTGYQRILRGGAAGDGARWCRSGWRAGGSPGFAQMSAGFRVAARAVTP